MGRHQSLPSGSLQQAPIQSSATRRADIIRKIGYNSIVCKNNTTPKTYKNEKAENYNSDKGARKKNTEEQLSDLEIINLHEKDFRLMIVIMSQDLGNKLEAKIDDIQ